MQQRPAPGWDVHGQAAHGWGVQGEAPHGQDVHGQENMQQGGQPLLGEEEGGKEGCWKSWQQKLLKPKTDSIKNCCRSLTLTMQLSVSQVCLKCTDSGLSCFLPGSEQQS